MTFHTSVGHRTIGPEGAELPASPRYTPLICYTLGCLGNLETTARLVNSLWAKSKTTESLTHLFFFPRPRVEWVVTRLIKGSKLRTLSSMGEVF